MSKMHAWTIDPREYARQEERRGRRYAFPKLDPARTALIVIDMIPFFLSESGYARGIVPNIAALADAIRPVGGVVCWVVPESRHRHPDLAAEFYGIEVAELYRRSGGEGPIAGRVSPDLRPLPDDLFFEKCGYSAFRPETCGLPAALQARGVDTVLITGTLTNVCCESSARDAFTEGFRVVMVADANAARRDAEHNATLHTIYRSFGDVRSTSDIEALLSGKPADA